MELSNCCVQEYFGDKNPDASCGRWVNFDATTIAAIRASATCPTLAHAASPLKLLCLINQHDWNIVLDMIFQPTRVANQLIMFRIVFQFTLALRTGQDFQ
jgi:hypothetical protein